MKFNEVHFFLGTVITHFLDKPYQEIDFKSYLNSILPYKLGKILSDLHMSWMIFFSLYLTVFTFTMRLKSSNCKSPWNVSGLFEYVPRNNVWFCFNSIVLVHFSYKTEKFQYWKSLKYFNIFFIKKDMVLHKNMSHGKMSDFVSFPLFGFSLVIKLRNVDFKGH